MEFADQWSGLTVTEVAGPDQNFEKSIHWFVKKCVKSCLSWPKVAGPGFYTKGCPLVKSNLICPSDKLSWQPGCPVLYISLQGNFRLSHRNASSNNLLKNCRPLLVSDQKTSFNSLWPSDGIWRHRTRLTIVQVMACCLTTPSHYLNQCWLISSQVQWASSGGDSTRDTTSINR